MAKASQSPPPRKSRPPGEAFRPQILAAIEDGRDPSDMTLRLTLRDASLLGRDKSIPVADISYGGGAMRYLGVRVEAGGVSESVLDRGET
jgi:hypothetical protein